MKRILSVILVLALVLTSFGVSAYAEDEKAKVYIKDTPAYEVEKDETMIAVPIFVDGTIDMQCYDIIVTYDDDLLNVSTAETIIGAPGSENEHAVVNTGTAGVIRLSGMTVREDAKEATGQIGTLYFTSAKKVRKDGVEVALGLEVVELGFGTEVADIEVDPDAVVTLNISAPPVTVVLGDVNEDTAINAQDALEILKHAAKITTLEGDPLTAADVDKDGSVNSTDALNVLKLAAGIIDSF